MTTPIEAAAAAIARHEWDTVGDAELTLAMPMAQVAITAYHASLAAEGEDGLVEAIRAEIAKHVVVRITDAEQAARAALAVARQADAGRVAKLQWSHDTLRWLIQHGGKAFYVLGDWWVEWLHNGVEQATETFNTLEDAMEAARRAAEAQHLRDMAERARAARAQEGEAK